MYKDTLIIYDDIPIDGLPFTFRTMQDQLDTSAVSLAGLDKLYASGSGQFSAYSLHLINQRLPKPLIIVDLREELHAFINEHPITWYHHKDTSLEYRYAEDTFETETTWCHELKQRTHATIFSLDNVPTPEEITHLENQQNVSIENAYPEHLLCKEYKLPYSRLPILENKPMESNVLASFITFLQENHKQKRWMHFHCRLGQGRTTMALALYDMIINAHQVSFDDIIKRQYLLGGYDLDDEYGERVAFLRLFYTNMKER